MDREALEKYSENFIPYAGRGLVFKGDYRKGKILSGSELSYIRRRQKALYVRNYYDFDIPQETNWWLIIQDKFLEVEEYRSKRFRQDLRRALRLFEYKRVSVEEFGVHGYSLIEKDAKHRGITPWLTSREHFLDYIAERNDGTVDFWLGYERETGAAVMLEIVQRGADYADEEFEKVDPAYLKRSPAYGMNYALLEYYLRDCGYCFVTAGARTLQERSNVQGFLVDRMHFRLAYMHFQLGLAPWLRILLALSYPFRRLIGGRSTKLKALYNMYGISKQ